MEKKNRYLAAEESQWADLSGAENAITFVLTAFALSAGGWWLASKYIEGTNLPVGLPFIAAILAPVLWVSFVNAWAKIKTVKDIEEEVEEAIETAIQTQAQAIESIEKANDYDRLKADNDRLAKDIERLKADNDRCWQSERALQEKLTTVQASATTVFEEAEREKQKIKNEFVLRLNHSQSEYFKLEKQFEALKEAVRMEGELGTLNGRSAKATTDEKEQIERQKQELRLNLAKHLQSNAFLQSLKPAWSIAK